jgi:hypothetical protein
MTTLQDIKSEYQMIVAVNYDFEISFEDYTSKFYIKVYDMNGTLLGYERATS